MRRLHLLYALGCTLWLLYFIHAIGIPPLGHGGSVLTRGFFLCFLLIVALPTSLGYLLLFKALPRLSRAFRR